MKHSFNTTIVPNRVIVNSEFYKIDIIDPELIIKQVDIYTFNKTKKINKIFIKQGIHPNANPHTGEFCIPDYIKKMEVNGDSLKIIENMITLFNFRSSYFQPWSGFKKQERSILNEEKV